MQSSSLSPALQVATCSARVPTPCLGKPEPSLTRSAAQTLTWCPVPEGAAGVVAEPLHCQRKRTGACQWNQCPFQSLNMDTGVFFKHCFKMFPLTFSLAGTAVAWLEPLKLTGCSFSVRPPKSKRKAVQALLLPTRN